MAFLAAGYLGYLLLSGGANGQSAAAGHVTLTTDQPFASYVVEAKVDGNEIDAGGLLTSLELVSFADSNSLPEGVLVRDSVSMETADLGDGRVVVEIRLEHPEFAPVEIRWQTSIVWSEMDGFDDLLDPSAWVDFHDLEISETSDARVWEHSTTWRPKADRLSRRSLAAARWNVVFPDPDATVLISAPLGTAATKAWLQSDSLAMDIPVGRSVELPAPQDCPEWGCTMSFWTVRSGGPVALYSDVDVKAQVGDEAFLTSQVYAQQMFTVPAPPEPGAPLSYDVDLWLADTVDPVHALTTFVSLEIDTDAGYISNDGAPAGIVPFTSCCNYSVQFYEEAAGERASMRLRYYYVVEPERVRTGFVLPEAAIPVDDR